MKKEIINKDGTDILKDVPYREYHLKTYETNKTIYILMIENSSPHIYIEEKLHFKKKEISKKMDIYDSSVYWFWK